MGGIIDRCIIPLDLRTTAISGPEFGAGNPKTAASSRARLLSGPSSSVKLSSATTMSDVSSVTKLYRRASSRAFPAVKLASLSDSKTMQILNLLPIQLL